MKIHFKNSNHREHHIMSALCW